ncbi:tRNA(Ile)-lysidine synthase [Parabacteroides sp. PF5-5]|uniref:tRNA lysidine(34) synthetase TilS n=1 Tax=unclassified Parabacteroides TaxID=2649774 RepID=UPI002476A986|nr:MULTISPECIES: tRNA lysidine(34) synthetase TilS [unclassified Parabacteroides]MDH6303936.1 tRNA(Ile)-lysidine synthase [Parabacteroides sp. PH5-39]MDH6314553.1 tRNA(Ile)-lysidine synthase [Parabacteroides sp. PF5-13]MDH6318382.1 tRNA(Ile)-lysidine synthase [Parabacteroides sp. PH5-13]MDH6322325.1 tRNA(Ile)-lysidine synthase [Parabacteroides sp. PH5-8]MDH6325595.1 tRNA(Ile)-lysidine synthase [Parabacteroides sp. PH5-41]
MIHTVHTFIHKYSLLVDGKPVVVGLSGGADSVVLLAILVQLGYPCIAAHCNFHLRGKESDRDEIFATNFAKKLHVPFHKKDFDTHQYAEKEGVSIEMAARELRYRWFEELRQQTDAQAIAVAHHKDDQVETVLMNLIRGTGIRGVRGMLPTNGYIIRPLLSASRKEILSWLEKEGLNYVTDSTNLSDAYTRNFVRLRVIPLLEEINPAARETIFRTAEHLASVELIYQSVIEEARSSVLKDNRICIEKLLAYPAPETILYEILTPYNFTRTLSESIFEALDKESGKTFFSSSHRLVKDRKHLLLSPIEKKEIPIELSYRKVVLKEEFTIEKDKNIAYFDYDKLTFPLSVRNWQPGDWFVPFGMKGRKKLSDFFSDQKYSLPEKEQAWLLCSGEDIIWIIGERTDNRFRIDKTTKSILIVNFSVGKQ